MFSQTTEYALRAMACLAIHPDNLMATPALAAQAKVPPNYLAKVLQHLAAAKLIVGRRGVGGGYKLTRPPGQVRLLEVINAVSPVERIHSCPGGASAHSSGLCPLHRRADEAAAAVIKVFNGVTLEDLMTDASPNRPLCHAHSAAAQAARAGNHKR